MNYSTFYSEKPEKILLIGDVHGKLDEYYNILYKNKDKVDKSIQIGDFGFKREFDNFKKSKWNTGDHKFVFGNHDYYPYLSEDFSYTRWSRFTHNGKRVMTIAGAYSIDREYRILGRDWWAEEEPNYIECDMILDDYISFKPEIVITHDAPVEIAEHMVRLKGVHQTQKLLSECHKNHKPELWYFGHYHQSWSAVYKGTMFRCLDELETVII